MNPCFKIISFSVTIDCESLLIALTHVQPDKNNIDAFIKLVRSMLKMPYINYNQKDSIGIPAIAHVLNSQNKVLFVAFINCFNLEYEPSLDYEFNSITDPEFKDIVLQSRIFENDTNRKFKTIFWKT